MGIDVSASLAETRLLLNKIKPQEQKDAIIEKAEEKAEDFKNLFKQILNENPNIAAFLKELDAKSSETFNHSVNVAMHVYADLSEKLYPPHEIKAWTIGALVHDTGKLNTDINILHTKVNIFSLPEADQKIAWKEMHSHSIGGLTYLKEHHIGNNPVEQKTAIACAIGHHVKAEALDKGPAGNFEGATSSRAPWAELYGEKGVEKLLMEECSWLKPRDIKALETVSFYDVIEALRANDRRYQLQHNWEVDDFTKNAEGKAKGPSVATISNNLIKNQHELSETFDGFCVNKDFQKEFDSYQAMELPGFAREEVMSRTIGQSFVLSEDKVNDIKEKPELGLEFFKRNFDGNNYYWTLDLDDDEPLVFGSTYGGSMPNFAAGIINIQKEISKEISLDVIENDIERE